MLAGYRDAVKHLGDAEPALTMVAGELRRTVREPWGGPPTGSDDPEAY